MNAKNLDILEMNVISLRKTKKRIYWEKKSHGYIHGMNLINPLLKMKSMQILL